jgi:hypothetical protein
MRQLQKYLLLFMAAIFFAGCASITPQKLGVSESEWRNYSPEQRTKLSADYQQAQNMRRAQLQQAKVGDSTLEVNIQGGRAVLPPYSELQAYQPVTFRIREGDCHREVSILSDVSPQQKGMMMVCYSGRVLYLDPSPYDLQNLNGSVLLRFMPTWRRGFTYPGVNTTGLVRLTDVNVSIKEN